MDPMKGLKSSMYCFVLTDYLIFSRINYDDIPRYFLQISLIIFIILLINLLPCSPPNTSIRLTIIIGEHRNPRRIAYLTTFLQQILGNCLGYNLYKRLRYKIFGICRYHLAIIIRNDNIPLPWNPHPLQLGQTIVNALLLLL